MKFQEPLVQDFMTLQPQAIDGKEGLEAARKMMSKFDIRHLPVTSAGSVVGILSERDLNRAFGTEVVKGQLLVIDACSEKPYIVRPDAYLREVVDFMAKRHVGSAVILDGARLVGIFTTVDACRALHDLLQETIEESRLEEVRRFRFCTGSHRGVRGRES